jgi:hypothetical protein
VKKDISEFVSVARAWVGYNRNAISVLRQFGIHMACMLMGVGDGG